jgi:uncharacterized membrane protein (Fun14 family)
MAFENVSSIVTTGAAGFLSSYLLAYFLSRLLKILMFIVGGIVALLLYLQSQEIISINITKLQTYTEGIFTSIVDATTAAANTTTSNHIQL